MVDGQSCVYGYDDGKGEYFKIPFEYVPVQFPGTGDIFSAPPGRKHTGRPWIAGIHGFFHEDGQETGYSGNTENVDKYKGIPIEKIFRGNDRI